MPVWSLFLLGSLASDKNIGKKEKVLCLQMSSGSLIQVVYWGLEMLPIARCSLITVVDKTQYAKTFICLKTLGTVSLS